MKCEGQTCKQEDVEIPLFFNEGTPIPCASQPSIDAAPSIKEVIGTRAVKTVTEEIPEYLKNEIFSGAKFIVDVRGECRLCR